MPIGLAIIATSLTFLIWLVGEQVISALWSATTNRMNEQGLAIAQTLRSEWIIIPAAIAVLLWIWAALVVTRRQATGRPGPFYILNNFRSNNRGIVAVIVVFGLTLVMAGLFWIVFTLPVSTVTDTLGLPVADDAQATVAFMQLVVKAIPVLVGVVLIGWGYTRTIEERETGYASL